MEYVSLIMLLLWGWGIWSFITLRRKIRKVKFHTTANNITSVDNFDDMRSSLRYSDWSCNIHYSNKD